MSNTMRWRYGDTNPVVVTPVKKQPIEIGDLVCLVTSERICVLRSRNLASRFLGVAMQESKFGEDDPIRVATTGVFEFDAIGRFTLGDSVAFCQPQSVHHCGFSAPVGVCVKQAAKRIGMALVEIRSRIMPRGVVGNCLGQVEV